MDPSVKQALEIEYPAAQDAVRTILGCIGEDINREGLNDTPARVVKSWREIFSGYKFDFNSLLTTFQDGVENVDGIILCRDIQVYSTCEHHMLPFTGICHIGYLPNRGNKKVIGLSKLPRLVNAFARRLQVQEKLTLQIMDKLEELLKPAGCGIVIHSYHSCMSCRGIRDTNASMVTSELRGSFKSQPATRAEFYQMINLPKLHM